MMLGTLKHKYYTNLIVELLMFKKLKTTSANANYYHTAAPTIIILSKRSADEPENASLQNKR